MALEVSSKPSGMCPVSAEPRWPALLAFLALGGLYAALPSSLIFGGPRWLLLLIVSVLLIPTIITHRISHHHLNQVLGYILNSIVTVAMIWSLVRLIELL